MPNFKGDENLPDDEDILRFLDGSSDAFEDIVRRYDSRLRAFVYPRVADKTTIDDIIQDTFLDASMNLHRFDRSRSLSTWLLGIANKKVLMSYRKSQSGSLISLDELNDQSIQFAGCADVERQVVDSIHLEELFHALPREQARAVYWVRILELEMTEAANLLSVNEATLRQRLHRSKAALHRAEELDHILD